MENNLTVKEKFFLLCIKPDTGGLVGGGAFPVEYSIIACLIKELESCGNIVINNGSVEISSFKNDDVLLDFVLSKFRKFNRPLKIRRWFSRLFYSLNHIKSEIKSRLVDKHLIKIEERRFLIFRYRKTCLINKTKARELADWVIGLIYKGEANEEWKFFLSLIEPAGLFPRLFPERENRKNARQRLKKMNPDNEISRALKKSIASTRAAMAT